MCVCACVSVTVCACVGKCMVGMCVVHVNMCTYIYMGHSPENWSKL